MQCGATPGTGIEALSLVARAYQDAVACTAMIFYDVRSAFYRVVRQLVVAVPETDEQLCALVQTLGLPQAALQELRSKLESAAALPQAGASPHVEALLADVLQGTYFRMEGSALLWLTKRGSRPGDPCADILFSFLLAAFFDAVDRALLKAQLQEEIPPLQAAPLTRLAASSPHLGFLSWADDCLQCRSAPTVSAVLHKAVSVLQITSEVASSLGISFAYASTKTCVMLPARKSPHARLLAAAAPQDEVPTTVQFWDSVSGSNVLVQIVDVYKHLGCVLTADRAPRAEVLYRYSQAVAVARPLGARFFAAQRFPLPIRRYMLKSLVMSRFVHGCVALNLHTRLSQRLWHKSYVSLWRFLSRRDGVTKKYAHAYHVLHWAQAPAPPLALAYARAVFLRKHVAAGPSVLFTYLQAHYDREPTRAWLHQLCGDIRAVGRYVPEVLSLLASVDPVRALVAAMEEQPTWWVCKVRRAHTLFLQDLAMWVEGVKAQGTNACAGPGGVGTDEGSCVQHPWVCVHCGATFPLRRYLATHQARRHQLLSPSRHFAPHCWCIACLRLYSSVQAVQTHLRHSRRCLTRALHLMPPMSAEEICQAEEEHKSRAKSLRDGQWHTFRKCQEVVQAYGPVQPVFDERWSHDPESVPLEAFAKLYRPSVRDLQWLDAYYQDASTVGPCQEQLAFWDVKPSERLQLPSFSNRVHVSPTA